MKNTIRMKRAYLFLTVWVTFFSCTYETDLDPVPVAPVAPVEEGYSEVKFSMQVPGHRKPAVYAATAEDENRITELDILAFAKQSNTIDTFAYRISVAVSEISDAPEATEGNMKTINTKLRRNDSDLKLVFVANSKAVLDNASLEGGQQLQAVMDKLVYEFDGKWPTFPNMRVFPMWGQTNGYISVKNPVVSEPVEVALLRAVAKVDVAVDLYGDPAIGFGSRFKLKNVYVYNARNKGSIAPDLSDAGLIDQKVTKPMLPAGNTAFANTLQFDVTDKHLVDEIYLPESSKDLSDHTCLVIKGVYDGGAETFYRIDFVNNKDEKLDLLRNHRFLVNITNVARDGFATIGEAFNAKTSHIVYSLGVTDENIKSIVYNGQYMLGVSDSKVLLGWDSSSNNVITVATDYTAEWTVSSNVDWIRIGSVTGGVNGQILYEVERNNDDSKLSREGIITVTAGSLVQEIILSQSLGANSFIVAPGSTMSIPVLFANADGTKRIADGTSLQAELVWQDRNGLISSLSMSESDGAKLIRVSAGSNPGNAVIAVKSNGTVLWSWHVWVTDYNPDIISSEKQHNGKTFMDRNLGATSIAAGSDRLGLLYQWGRKDPFPGSSSVSANTQKTVYDFSGLPVAMSVEQVILDNNFPNAVNHPFTFYTSIEFPWYNWSGLGTPSNSLWISPQGGKTAYDPCPQGWRVPTTTRVWSGIGTVNWQNGYTITPDLGFYPAAGSVDFTDGTIADVGRHGYYWSAEPSSVKAKAFHIDASGSSIESSPFRASGASVRCVKE